MVKWIALMIILTLTGTTFLISQSNAQVQQEEQSQLQQELDNFNACQVMNINHSNRQRMEYARQIQAKDAQIKQLQQQIDELKRKGEVKDDKSH